MLLTQGASDREKINCLEKLISSKFTFHIQLALVSQPFSDNENYRSSSEITDESSDFICISALEIAIQHTDGTNELLEYLLSNRFLGIWTF